MIFYLTIKKTVCMKLEQDNNVCALKKTMNNATIQNQLHKFQIMKKMV